MGKKNESVGAAETHLKIESKYNPTVLMDCIQAGLHAHEIMDRMNIRHKQTLKQYAAKLMSDEKTFFEIKGLFKRNNSHLIVNSKGVLRIPLMSFIPSDFNVSEGDEFSVSFDGGCIILKKV
ncbi:hypothetical protein JCM15519_37960 [Fundidesulfovibrio butyratiphilus]